LRGDQVSQVRVSRISAAQSTDAMDASNRGFIIVQYINTERDEAAPRREDGSATRARRRGVRNR